MASKTMMRGRIGVTVVATLVGVALSMGTTTGCAPQADESASATTTSALQVQSQSAFTDGVLDTDETLAPDPAVAAQKVAVHPMPNLYPAGCATKVAEGDVVTITLHQCTGPFGKVVLEGGITATFSKTSADVLHVELATSADMKANGGPLTWQASVDIAYDGSQRTLTYHGDSNGQTERGVAYQRHTDLTISADISTHCGQIDGVSKGSVGKYEIDLSVTGLKGCRNACPTAGTAKATVDGPLVANTSIQVSFDGSSEAHVEVDARKKRDVDVALDCSAGEAAE